MGSEGVRKNFEEKEKNSLRSFLVRIIVIPMTVALILITSVNVHAERSVNETAAGLQHPTSAQRQWMDTNMIDTGKVRNNSLGLHRINRYLKSKGKKELNINYAAPMGEEVQSAPEDKFQEFEQIPDTSEVLPDSIDNSKTRYFPPIRSQGSTNACASFSTSYYQMTYMTALVRGWDVSNLDDSNKFSPKWTYNMINSGKDGGSWITESYKVMLKNGAATWDEFPFDGNCVQWCTNPETWKNALQYKAEATGVVKYIDTEEGLNNIKRLLNNGYILSIATYINSWQWTTIKDDPNTSLDNEQENKKSLQ